MDVTSALIGIIAALQAAILTQVWMSTKRLDSRMDTLSARMDDLAQRVSRIEGRLGMREEAA